MCQAAISLPLILLLLYPKQQIVSNKCKTNPNWPFFTLSCSFPYPPFQPKTDPLFHTVTTPMAAIISCHSKFIGPSTPFNGGTRFPVSRNHFSPTSIQCRIQNNKQVPFLGSAFLEVLIFTSFIGNLAMYMWFGNPWFWCMLCILFNQILGI